MADITKDGKPSVLKIEYASGDEESVKNALNQSQTMGTVTMTDDTDVFLVPAPSADPRGHFA
jgi:hypothetical protein